MDRKQQHSKRRKRKPGKLCVVMFCNKTNADGVSLHQFPADESVRRKWIAFVRTKREPNSWTPGSAYICSDHFSAGSYEGFGAKIAGFSSKLVLKKSAVPSIHASPTPEQVNEALRKTKLPLSNKQSRVQIFRGHAGDFHDTKTTKSSLIKTNGKQGMRNIFRVLIIVAFLDLVQVYLIQVVALVSKVVIYF